MPTGWAASCRRGLRAQSARSSARRGGAARASTRGTRRLWPERRRKASICRCAYADDILLVLIPGPRALLAIIPVVLCGVLARPAASRQDIDPPVDGAAIFERACSGCHTGDDPRAPGMDALRGRSPQAIVDALTSGPMRYQGLALSGEERRAVAEYLSGRKLRGTVAGATAGACTTRT